MKPAASPTGAPATAKAQPAGARSSTGRAAPSAAAPGYLQARLAVSQPRDAAEQEADQTARTLVQDLQPGALPRPLEAGAPTRLFRQTRPAAPVLPTSKGSGTEPPTRSRDAPAAVEQQVAERRGRSAGQAMPPLLQRNLGQRLGADLSAVRLHTDADAAALCAQMQARAFTVGSDIYFAAGVFDPASAGGVELIAHELTHVLQQGAAATAPADAPQALQRDGFIDWLLGTNTLADPRAVARQRLAEADTWARAGPYPATPQTLIGAAGRGGFDAQYLPDASTGLGRLQITQGVAVSFNDSFVVNAGVIQPHPSMPAAVATNPNSVSNPIGAQAARLQALPPARRAKALAAYQWTAAEQAPWLRRAEQQVEATWSARHSFFLNQPQWAWLGAHVQVDIQAGARAQVAADHMTMAVFKLPPSGNLNDWGIDNATAPGAVANVRDQHIDLGSSTVDVNSFNNLRQSVYFANGQSTLSATAGADLVAFVARFNGATSSAAHQPAQVELVGHTSAAGTELDNQALALARAQAVQQYLLNNGFNNALARTTLTARGEAEADPRRPFRGADQRVDLVVDGGAAQLVIAHEFGHALGLGDEYATGAGAVGTAAGHDAMAQAMSRADGSHLPGAVREHTGGIMSFGNEVRPQHYAVFHHALAQVTGRSPWALGDSVPKWRVQLDCGVPALLNDRPPDAVPNPAVNPGGSTAGGGGVLV